ncbi:MAG: PilT/PilU family type 4a pilus ATPase [Rhodanobacteraceae bacterium]|nr:PilT/PilU family type 4a pilus ATPase [Rhodanobacteraceae bacterium]
MNNEIRWFCHLATTRRVLTPDDCAAVVEAFAADNIQPDLQDFVQAFVDNNLCKQPDQLEAVMNEAADAAGGGPAPRLRWLPGDAPAVPPGAEGWLCGWPQLEQAATASADQARDIMYQFLQQARACGCSDVHVSAGARPFVRRFKHVHLLPDQDALSPEAAQALNLSVLDEAQFAIFQQHHDLDFSFNVGADERYRTNLMLQRLGVSGSYRVVDTRIPSLRELGFARPEILEKLTTYHQGLILVTGPAGCGKSTTLTAFIDYLNTNRHDHIITVEDPIEVVHQPKNCNVTQREVRRHTRTFASALRAALREDPDIIIIGELRDLETIEMAIRASETGHLVIGTLHTGSAATTMDRVLDVFPPSQQAQVRAMAAESLKGVVCQELLPNRDNDGLVLAAEIMLGTLAVSNIVREGETFKLPSIIQTSYNTGMCSMEQSYFDLYMADQRSYDQTAPQIRNPELLRRMQINEAQRNAQAAGLNKKKRGWFG